MRWVVITAGDGVPLRVRYDKTADYLANEDATTATLTT